MSNLKYFIALIILNTFIGCAPIKVSSQQDQQVDIANLNTYAWGVNSLTADRVAGSVNEVIQNVENMARRDIQKLTDAELANKGYRIAEQGKPDFLVRYTARGQAQGSLERNNYAPAESPYLVNNAGTFLIGYLTIDILDPETQQIIWRGNAEAVIKGDGTSNTRLKRTIEKILKKLPSK